MTDPQVILAVFDALWGKDADQEWNADTLDAIADMLMAARPELYKQYTGEDSWL